MNIEKYNIEILEPAKDVYDLVTLLLEETVLTKRNYRDLTHIAFSIIYQIDYLVSWNFDDIVNSNTIKKIRIFCMEHNLKNLDIYNPMEVK